MGAWAEAGRCQFSLLTLSGKDPRAKPKDQSPESHTEKLELGKARWNRGLRGKSGNAES